MRKVYLGTTQIAEIPAGTNGGGLEGGYLVRFLVNGEPYCNISVLAGDAVQAPSEPSEVIFAGWYTSETGGQEVTFPFTPAGDTTIYARISQADPVFANNNWATIRVAVRSGTVPATWAVGDMKDITLSNGQTISYRIADKQAGRYALADGSGSSNMVLEPVDLISNLYGEMNSNNTNAGGFAQSAMRTVTLVNVLSMFPADVQNAMSEVMVLSGTGSGTTSGTSSSANKIFLAAEAELFASKNFSIGDVECPLGQFDYYKTHTTDSERIKQTQGTNMWYFLRSPRSGNSSDFCIITNVGAIKPYGAGNGGGIAPFFAI